MLAQCGKNHIRSACMAANHLTHAHIHLRLNILGNKLAHLRIGMALHQVFVGLVLIAPYRIHDL